MRQRGFTLIEVLVTMAVGGVILMCIVSGIYMVTFGTARSNSQVVALNEVNRASLYLKKDLSTYNTAELSDEQPDSITIDWTDATFQPDEDPREYKATYSLSGTDLKRIYTIGSITTPEQIIGRHITYLSFTREEYSRFIDVVITATAGDMVPRSETLSFSVYQLKEIEE